MRVNITLEHKESGERLYLTSKTNVTLRPSSIEEILTKTSQTRCVYEKLKKRWVFQIKKNNFLKLSILIKLSKYWGVGFLIYSFYFNNNIKREENKKKKLKK